MLGAAAWAGAAFGAVVGLETPAASTHTDLGPSALAEGHVLRRCAVYAAFAVIEDRDPGRKGAARIAVRPRAADEATSAACASEQARPLPLLEGYLAGVIGPYVIVTSADAVGPSMATWVVDAASGKVVTELANDSTAPLTFSRVGAAVRVDYAVTVASSCAPIGAGTPCWTTLAAKHHVPAAVTAPDCAAAFARAKASPDADAIVSLPARIADLAHPAVTIVAGRAGCAPSP